jgi:hypothetical protein
MRMAREQQLHSSEFFGQTAKNNQGGFDAAQSPPLDALI